eukprot:6490859-Amphidinium_carterae.1
MTSDWGDVSASACLGSGNDVESEPHVGVVAGQTAIGANADDEGWGFVAAQADAEAIGTAQDPESALDIPVNVPSATYMFKGKRAKGRPKKPKFDIVLSSENVESQSVQPSTHHNAEAGAGLLSMTAFGVQHSLVSTFVQHASLRVPRVDTFSRASQDGFIVPSICTEALAACAKAADNPKANMDEDYFKIQASYVRAGPGFHCETAVVTSQRLGISRFALENKLCRLACAHIIYNKFRHSVLEQEVALRLGQESLICHCECVGYDETPLKTSSKRAALPMRGVELTESMEESGLELDIPAMKRMTALVKDDTVSAKVLQTGAGFGMCVKVRGIFAKLVGSQICPLQVLGKGTSEVLFDALTRSTYTSKWAKHFKLTSRIACVDRGAYNLKTENNMVHARGAGSLHMLLRCAAHVCSGCLGSTFSTLMPEKVSGIIATSLSLRCGNALNVFRYCLQEEIADKLVILHGTLSCEARVWKEKAQKVFMSGSCTKLVDKVLLQKLPNGDWRKRDVVEYFCPLGSTTSSRQAVAKVLSVSLIQVLLASKPHVFTRHRWTGMDVCLDELGRLEVVHGLLSSTYARFLKLFAKKGVTFAGVGAQASLLDAGTQCAVAENMAVEGGADPREGGHDGVALAASADAFAGGEAAPEENRAAEEHAADRLKAAGFMSSSPLSNLVLMRLCVNPLLDLMTDLLRVSGESYELEQRSLLLQKLNGDVAMTKPLRHYQLTLTADGVLERKYFERLAEVFTSDLWDVVQADNINVMFNSLAFRSLSRQGCVVEESIALVHRGFPYKFFGVLTESIASADIRDAPECMLDPFSATLRAQHPTCEGNVVEEILELHAMLGSITIASIESRHSSVRRHLVMRSVQTQPLSVHQLSAAWVLQNLRGAARQLQEKSGKFHSKDIATKKVSWQKQDTPFPFTNPCNPDSLIVHYIEILPKPERDTHNIQRNSCLESICYYC